MTPSSSFRAIGPREWLLLTALSVLWGGSYLFMKIAVASLPVFVIVFGRVSIAAAMLALVLLATGHGIPRRREHWVAFFGMGLFNNVLPMSLIVFGTHSINAGLASIINAMTPLFTIVMAHLVTHDERLSVYKIAGVILGLCGVIVLIGPGLLFSVDGSTIGELACLTAALSYASANIFGRRFVRLGLKPLQIALGQVTASTIILFPILLAQNWNDVIEHFALTAVVCVLALGILCTGMAYVIYFAILNRSGATAVALVTLMIPPSAIALGAVFLDETLTSQQMIGMMLIGAGLVAVNRRIA